MKKFVGIALSMVLAGALHAQGFGPGGFPPPGPGLGVGLPLRGLLEELDSTAAQQQQVKQILGAPGWAGTVLRVKCNFDPVA